MHTLYFAQIKSDRVSKVAMSTKELETALNDAWQTIHPVIERQLIPGLGIDDWVPVHDLTANLGLMQNLDFLIGYHFDGDVNQFAQNAFNAYSEKVLNGTYQRPTDAVSKNFQFVERWLAQAMYDKLVLGVESDVDTWFNNKSVKLIERTPYTFEQNDVHRWNKDIHPKGAYIKNVTIVTK